MSSTRPACATAPCCVTCRPRTASLRCARTLRPSRRQRVAAELQRQAARLAAGGVDHSLGRLFLETAQSEAAAETGAANAAAIARDVLPRYLGRARSPAKPAAPRAARGRRSRWSAGPTPETSRTQQVCWHTAWRRDSAARCGFVSENYGDSELAKRFGVRRYPAIFVDDVLVATPKDFGFYGKGEGQDGGRYAPIKSAASHERFRADLTRMIELILAGRKDAARAQAAPSDRAEIAALPAFTLADLDGKPITREDLAGRTVLVEFWATWCPPCRSTLGWLGEMKKRHGDRVVVLAIAVESETRRTCARWPRSWACRCAGPWARPRSRARSAT